MRCWRSWPFYSAGAVAFADGRTVAVDKPALVQLQKGRAGWNITVQKSRCTTPTKPAIAASSEFRHILLPGANQITIDLSLSLQTGTYMYNTQGPDLRLSPDKG